MTGCNLKEIVSDIRGTRFYAGESTSFTTSLYQADDLGASSMTQTESRHVRVGPHTTILGL